MTEDEAAAQDFLVEPSGRVPFDPTRPDCFARHLNMTDDQITTLVLQTRNLLRRQGEYDQGDTAVLHWDDAQDVATVAEMLWHHILRERNEESGGVSGTWVYKAPEKHVCDPGSVYEWGAGSIFACACGRWLRLREDEPWRGWREMSPRQIRRHKKKAKP